MANVTKIVDSDGNDVYLKDYVLRTDSSGGSIYGYTKDAGTIKSISTGAGLTGGPITDWGAINAALKSTATSTLLATAKGTTANREYPIGLDKNGLLSVNVPWTNTTYSAGTGISISTSSGNPSTVSCNTNIIGKRYSSTTAVTTSIPHNSYKDAVDLSGSSLPVGVYIITGTVTWSGNQGGYRKMLFGTSATASSAISEGAICQLPAYNNNASDQMQQQLTAIINKTSADSKIYLVVYQNCGVTLTISNPGIHAVRLS